MKFGPGALRYCLALLVVVHHSFPARLGAFAVYAFFALSGYWITRMWTGRYAGTCQPYLTFLVSRWWRLAPVFFLCLLLALLAAHFNPQAIQPPADLLAWLVRQIPIAGSSAAGRVLPPTWSLDVEMQFYLVAPLLILGAARLPRVARQMIFIATVFITVAYFVRGGSAEVPALWPFLSCFLVGMAIAGQAQAPGRLWVWGGGGLALAGTFVLACWPATAAHLFARGRDVLDHSSAAARIVGIWWVACVFLLAPFISWNVRQPSPKWDARLGAMAYPLYLFHWIPRDLYYAFSPEGGMARLLALAGNIAAAVIGAYLINRLFDEPIDRLRQGWVKSRSAPRPVPQPVV